MTPTLRLFLLTALTMLAFAGNSLLNRAALAGDLIGPSGFAMIRVIAGAVVLALLVWRRDRRWADLAEVSWKSTGALALYVLGFSHAYIWLDAGIGALFLFGGVQITMFAGALIGGERPSPQRWAGAALAFGGLVLLLAPSTNAPSLLGAGLMLAAAFGWGMYSLYGRQVKRPLQATAGNFLLAVPIALIVGWSVPDAMPATSPGVILAVLSGAVTSGLGYALWYTILPRLAATLAAVAQLTVPVIAAAGGALLLAEFPGFSFLIASVLVLGGVALSVWRKT